MALAAEPASVFPPVMTRIMLMDLIRPGPGSAIYCWDTLRNRESSLASGNAQAISGIQFLQLSDATHLKIQRSSQHNSCPSATDSLSFDNAAMPFER